jgi:hypothetical protein
MQQSGSEDQQVSPFGSGWGGESGSTGLAPQCIVPNETSDMVRRYHTRHQNYRRYHYHHAPDS